MTSLATTLGLRAGSAGAFVPNYAAAYLSFNFAWSYIGCTLVFNDFLFSPYLSNMALRQTMCKASRELFLKKSM
jgi:hypothetical protein